MSRAKHNHYFKSVKGLDEVDVYRVLKLFDVTDPCMQHAVKKILVAGGRGAGKDQTKDIQEAIDTLMRFLEIQDEDRHLGESKFQNIENFQCRPAGSQ